MIHIWIGYEFSSIESICIRINSTIKNRSEILRRVLLIWQTYASPLRIFHESTYLPHARVSEPRTCETCNKFLMAQSILVRNLGIFRGGWSKIERPNHGLR